MSDLIRREDAIDAISKLPVKVDNLGYTWMIANDVLNQIGSTPSAESERMKGKWIEGKAKHIKNGEIRNVRECSVCGSSYFIYDRYNSREETPKYCPNCGADMRDDR